jgi:hypothetical protein
VARHGLEEEDAQHDHLPLPPRQSTERREQRRVHWRVTGRGIGHLMAAVQRDLPSPATPPRDASVERRPPGAKVAFSRAWIAELFARWLAGAA